MDLLVASCCFCADAASSVHCWAAIAPTGPGATLTFETPHVRVKTGLFERRVMSVMCVLDLFG